MKKTVLKLLLLCSVVISVPMISAGCSSCPCSSENTTSQDSRCDSDCGCDCSESGSCDCQECPCERPCDCRDCNDNTCCCR